MIRAMPFLAAALSGWHSGMQQVVLVGDPSDESTRAMNDELSRHYLPFTVIVPVHPGERQERLTRLLPFMSGMMTRDGNATAYVCRNFTCQAPVTDATALRDALLGRVGA